MNKNMSLWHTLNDMILAFNLDCCVFNNDAPFGFCSGCWNGSNSCCGALLSLMTTNGSGILGAGGQPELVVVWGSGILIAGGQPELVFF
jgi:hypothetical protein